MNRQLADLVVLNNGGGTQSGAIMEMIAEGLLPKPDVIIQADTGMVLCSNIGCMT